MITPPVPSDNTQTPINSALLPLDQKTLIIHREIRVRQSPERHKLIFSVYNWGNVTGTTVDQFALKQAQVPPGTASVIENKNSGLTSIFKNFISSIARRAPTDTPFDINPSEMCFLVMELDPLMNWEFTPGSLGVTTKHIEPKDEDSYLCYVTKDKVVKPTDPEYSQGIPKNCRVIYWSIHKRKYHLGKISRGFNFYVDFLQNSKSPDGTITEHRMPTIFDPNVPNTGGSEFP